MKEFLLDLKVSFIEGLILMMQEKRRRLYIVWNIVWKKSFGYNKTPSLAINRTDKPIREMGRESSYLSNTAYLT